MEATAGECRSEVDLEMETPLIEVLRRISLDVVEMYNPPRVAVEANKFRLRVGESMDLVTGWDFSKREHRHKAMQYIDKLKPKLIVGSPMCTILSSLQNLSGWNSEKERRWREDRGHLAFMGSVYQKQVKEGRWFLHEHPAAATSWSLNEITKVMEMKGVQTVVGDQCMYGLKTWGQDGRSWERARQTRSS